MATGYATEASGHASFTQGYGNKASGEYSLAAGHGTKATNTSAVAFGTESEANGANSMASGYKAKTKDIVPSSHAFGYAVETKGDSSKKGQMVVGRYNDIEKTYTQGAIFAVGCGDSEDSRKNAFSVNESSDGKLSLYIGDVNISEEKFKELSESEYTTTATVNDLISKAIGLAMEGEY